MKSENQMLRDHADPGVQQEIDLQDQLDLRMVSQSIIFIYAYLEFKQRERLRDIQTTIQILSRTSRTLLMEGLLPLFHL